MQVEEETFELSEILGRGTEISDLEFSLYVTGEFKFFTQTRLVSIEVLVQVEPWSSEIARGRKEFADHLQMKSQSTVRGSDAHEWMTRLIDGVQN